MHKKSREKLLKIGEKVRLSLLKPIFAKETDEQGTCFPKLCGTNTTFYLGNWTEEVFLISKVHLHHFGKATYEVTDLEQKPLEGRFYRY